MRNEAHHFISSHFYRVVVWDHASIHRALEVKAFLSEEPAGRIHLAAQPGYRPELNADEPAWNWLKYHQLKNVCGKTLAELEVWGNW